MRLIFETEMKEHINIHDIVFLKEEACVLLKLRSVISDAQMEKLSVKTGDKHV